MVDCIPYSVPLNVRSLVHNLLSSLYLTHYHNVLDSERMERRKMYCWLRDEKRRKFCCETAILIARIKVVNVLFDHINEAIICDGNLIFLLARRFRKPRYTN